MSEHRAYTYADLLKLPGFIRVELIGGAICTDDWTALEIDEAVFQSEPAENRHVTYRLSVVKTEEIPGKQTG